VAEDLGAELQQLAAGGRPLRSRMQHRAAMAQARHPAAVEQVGIDAGGLGGGVGAQAERAAAELVHELEGVQVGRPAVPDEERLQVLQQRRHDMLEAMPCGEIQQAAPERLHAPGLGRQGIGKVLRQHARLWTWKTGPR
jgi:hypothetical protein